MTVQVQEGELNFDFSGATAVDRLDVQDQPIPHGMALVDFVVEETGQILLIEIKDPSQSGASERERARFAKKLEHETLIHQELVPKARDSYAFLHLMERDTKTFLYVVVLGLETLPDKAALLVNFKDRLLKRIRHEGREPWRRQYVKDCVVLTPKIWPEHFPGYSLSRSPHQ